MEHVEVEDVEVEDVEVVAEGVEEEVVKVAAEGGVEEEDVNIDKGIEDCSDDKMTDKLSSWYMKTVLPFLSLSLALHKLKSALHESSD